MGLLIQKGRGKMETPKDLSRFLTRQEYDYALALSEIRGGRKESHWMWYIFPQLRGLGESYDAWYYGIADLEEARAYLEHPVLGDRLREISQALLELEQTDPRWIFGWTDSLKLRSCMTLFLRASGESVFAEVLDRFYGGREDQRTLSMLEEPASDWL